MLTPERLRCERLVDPLGVDAVRPRLTWSLRARRRGALQTAYHVLVASSRAALDAGRGDLWDTGRVGSADPGPAVYAGAPLRSAMRCWWKVRVWDERGEPSRWSPAARWEMGLLEPSDWHGQWIARTLSMDPLPAPLLRREFDVDAQIGSARLWVCGLGYHEVRINGEKVGDHVRDPGYTRYDRRALYVAHDVTRLLRRGRNAVGAVLGTGWYNVHTRAVWYFDRAPWRGAPRLLLELRITYRDGREQIVATDLSWRAATGPIVYDSIYGGESYDARLEIPGWDRPGFDDSRWSAAIAAPAPGGRLAAQIIQPIRVTARLPVRKVSEPAPGVAVCDFGQNLAGHVRVQGEGPAGATVRIAYGERLDEAGRLDRREIAQHMIADPPQRFQTDEYTFRGAGREEWEARFTYHGFQYVELTGAPSRQVAEDLTACVAHTDVPATGSFQCSEPLYERIAQAARWAFLSNLQSIPTDCPHREKNGWTADAHLAAEQALYTFDPTAVYAKWVRDLADEQRPSGELPGIVPTSGWGYDWGNGPAWDSALLLLPWYVWLYTGDDALLREHYDAMRRYVDFVGTRADDGLVSWGLGDWAPVKTETPAALTSTAYYHVDARIVAFAAERMGKAEDAKRYAALAEEIRQAWTRAFYDPATGRCGPGSQTAQACALYQGLCPPADRDRVLRRLVEAVEATNGHIDTGILGAKYLLHALTDAGRADVAHRVASQANFPSWGHWLAQGATTLWEMWDGSASRNHIMYGDIVAWFYRGLAGIQPTPDEPGFRRIVLRPSFPPGLQWVKASTMSPRGEIRSEWERDGARLRYAVRVPAGSRATVWLPATDVSAARESGKPLGDTPAVRVLERREGCTVVETGSGDYIFESALPA